MFVTLVSEWFRVHVRNASRVTRETRETATTVAASLPLWPEVIRQ